MRAFILIFIVSLVVTLLSVPLVRRFALHFGFVDAPAQRKMHRNPIPLLGGVAIFAGAVGAMLTSYQALPRTVLGAILAGSLVALIGLMDDRLRLNPFVRLLAQFTAAVVLVHFRMSVRLPFLPDLANYGLTFLWLVGITNAINLLDNMDGLSAGVTAVAAAFMMLLGSLNGQFVVAAMAASMLGSCLGFLRYNFPPAQIFMGDAGAYFLGFWLAVLGIQLRFPNNVPFVTWMVPVLVLGLPIFDTTLVSISRVRRGLHPFTAGKDHVSHRLMLMGLSSREAVLACYLICGIFGMTALFVTQANREEGYFIGACVLVVCSWAFLRLEKVYRQAQAS